MNDIESLYDDKLVHDLDVSNNKVLCIVEGKDELSFIKKVYELYNNVISCQDFLDIKIELSWGKEPIVWRNKEKCNFQGGGLKGCPTPGAVLEALYANDLEMYKAILVVFDSDCDKNSFVKNQSKLLLEEYTSFIFSSLICFERVAMELIGTNTTDEYIMKNYKIIDYSLCKWYKDNYRNIPKSEHYRRVQTLERVIALLRLDDIEKEELSISKCIEFMKNNI